MFREHQVIWKTDYSKRESEILSESALRMILGFGETEPPLAKGRGNREAVEGLTEA